jgi:hypothetical protein
MPQSTIIFRMPQDFAALQGPIADFPSECDRINYNDLDNLGSQLRDLVGELIQIDFDEPDPADPVLAFVEALKGSDVPYLAGHPSHEEPSRRERYLGRFLVRTADFVIDRRMPWEQGEPDISEPITFRKAGFTEQQLRVIDNTFFTVSAPTPRV